MSLQGLTPPMAVPALLFQSSHDDDDFSDLRHSTPPPLESPLPRTPKPRRFLSPPKTPLSNVHTSFGPDESEEVDFSMLHAGMAIARPSSSCSMYSVSSDSSMDSCMTYSTADGSCTSIEDEDGYFADEATPKAKGKALDSAPEPQRRQSEDKGKQKRRTRKTRWTEAMDAHLWRTYILYQQDPKITPFFVLPGQVPPLGVCYKVAREAKRSWKEAKLRGDYKSPVTTPKPKKQPRATADTGNRGDALRKTTPYTWPASESSTRRRLRELSRGDYGPSLNPHSYHQQRRFPTASSSSRSTLSPSPLNGGSLQRTTARDPFSTTRSMALSLTTSTASSMRPSGALASLSSGHDIDASLFANPRPDFHFGGIAERIENNGFPNHRIQCIESLQEQVLETGSLQLGLELNGSSSSSSSSSSSQTTPTHHHHELVKAKPSLCSSPSLLPPLELKSSKSPYGTWPRRLKRGDPAEDETTTPAPPLRRPRRGTLGDLFGGELLPGIPATAPVKRTARARGHTISAGTSLRRRSARPSLAVTGPVSYDAGNYEAGSSPLGRRSGWGGAGTTGDGVGRLGSPFVERGSKREG